MTEQTIKIETLTLNDKTKIKVETVTLPPTGDQKVGIMGDLKFDEITNVIEAIAEKLQSSIQKAKPKKASVEFGLAIGVESGQLTALWVKGQGTANIKVTLEWEN